MLIVLPNELEILRDMQPLDRDVFNYLAERVDYESGVVGASRRVSYGGLAHDLTEHDGERRRPESLRKVSLDQARNAVRRLIACGLLKSLSERGKHNDLLLVRVFWACLMGAPSLGQNADASQTPDQPRHVIGILSGIIKHLAKASASSRQTETRPDAITSYTQHHQQQASYPDAERFPMSLDWQATETEFKAVLQRAGFNDAGVKPAWIAEFVAYWFAEGQRHYTQKEWTVRLALRIVDYLANPGQFDRLRGWDEPQAANGAKGAGSGHTSGRPDWARIPRNDDDLTPWAVRHGYGQAAIGQTFNQYRAALRDKVERRMRQQQQH